MNWRGKPLVSHEVIVSLIAATKSSTGLTVQAPLDTGTYPKGISNATPFTATGTTPSAHAQSRILIPDEPLEHAPTVERRLSSVGRSGLRR